MKLLVIALAASSIVSPTPAPATETGKALELRPKSAIAGSVAHQEAPFVNPSAEPSLSLVPRTGLEPRQASRSPCSVDGLCYDSGSGHLVYKGARRWMPELPGLQPENISLKRNRIVFRYSF